MFFFFFCYCCSFSISSRISSRVTMAAQNQLEQCLGIRLLAVSHAYVNDRFFSSSVVVGKANIFTRDNLDEFTLQTNLLIKNDTYTHIRTYTFVTNFDKVRVNGNDVRMIIQDMCWSTFPFTNSGRPII